MVDEDNEVIGLVSYSLVAAAKQRLWNKEKKRKRQEQEAKEKGKELPKIDEKVAAERRILLEVSTWVVNLCQLFVSCSHLPVDKRQVLHLSSLFLCFSSRYAV